ncbi:MAG: aspartate aminotransferase family protein [Planctomycetes bacterium]|nr:aspartate aminotransferase family protein [Planctomycetota bacterium]
MFDLKALIAENEGKSLDLAEQYVNPAFAKVLRILGFDVNYVRGQGQYLWDDKGNRYIDCLGGFGVFACGRNHPVIRKAIQDAMDLDLPNLVKMGPYKLSGLLARELIKIAPPGLEMVYFTNCGAAGVETAMKYARAATGRNRILFCKKGYHGLTLGALSINGGDEFRSGFGDLMPATMVPFNDLAALEAELSKGDVAGFIVEPIQGKGVVIPSDDYLPAALKLCRKHGTIFVADEVQTGYGRTGKMFACEHWGIEPDILITSKALSGGYVPVGAVLSRRAVHEKVFSSLDRCMVHSNTFGQNDLAMAAGLVTLHVLKEEEIVENSAAMGSLMIEKLTPLIEKYELVKDVRGKGLMVAVEFGAPRSMLLKAQWALLHKLDSSLFPQAILMPLLKDHHILAQVAGHHQDVVKMIPPLVLNAGDVQAIADAFDTVIASCSRMSGPMWEVGKRLGSQFLKRNKAEEPAPVA